MNTEENINANNCKCQDIQLESLTKYTLSEINEINQIRMIFNIFSIACLVLAMGFTIISFVLTGSSQIFIIIFAILFYIAFFICNKIKRNKLK